MEEYRRIVSAFLDEYQKETPSLQKIIDVFLVYILLTGIIQFIYVVVVGTFPFNSFLSGFISTVGCFVLAVSLRMHIDPRKEIQGSVERAFADFVLGNIVLFLFVLNFMG